MLLSASHRPAGGLTEKKKRGLGKYKGTLGKLVSCVLWAPGEMDMDGEGTPTPQWLSSLLFRVSQEDLTQTCSFWGNSVSIVGNFFPDLLKEEEQTLVYKDAL